MLKGIVRIMDVSKRYVHALFPIERISRTIDVAYCPTGLLSCMIMLVLMWLWSAKLCYSNSAERFQNILLTARTSYHENNTSLKCKAAFGEENCDLSESTCLVYINQKAMGSLVVRAQDSRPEGLGSMPVPPNTLQVHSEYVLVKSVGPKVLWAESRVQGTEENFPPLQFHA
ncbi:uncharacterized protein TNCV_1407351 [Trichonephila clavipes]|nr:uncharacterized protein TNCV_1407351 [Trichonephila clavipes]